MIIANWNGVCWELKEIVSRGRIPRISLKNHIVSQKSEDVVREIILRRSQNICDHDLSKIVKHKNVCNLDH